MDEAFFEVDCTSARLLLQVFCRPPPRAPFLPPRAPRRPSSTAPHLLQPVRSGSDMAYHCQKPRAAPARKCVVSHRRPPAAAGDGDVRKHKIRLFEPPRIGATRTRPLATPRHERCGSGAFMVRDASRRPPGDTRLLTMTIGRACGGCDRKRQSFSWLPARVTVWRLEPSW